MGHLPSSWGPDFGTGRELEDGGPALAFFSQLQMAGAEERGGQWGRRRTDIWLTLCSELAQATQPSELPHFLLSQWHPPVYKESFSVLPANGFFPGTEGSPTDSPPKPGHNWTS